MIDIKKSLILQLKTAVEDLLGQEFEPKIDYPEESFGDYSSNIALIASKILKANPLTLAERIKNNLPKMEYIEKIEVAKPGFINFWISKNYLANNLQEVLNKKEYGSKPQDLSKKVVVEYSSPNIAKPFTVAHLRSTIIGDAIANLLEVNGWKVYRDNHLGDWGTQFGKQIYAIKTWGNEEKIEKSQNPVKELVSLYVKFHEEAEKNPELEEKGREWFKRLEDGDSEARRLWEKCIEWSLKEFQKIYDILGVKFTENNGKGYGESFFEDKMESAIKELEEKNLLKESEGAKLVFFEKDKYPPLMILKRDGATLYATRDLATDKFRLKEHGKDVVIINEVGIEQNLYFRQLFELEKMLGWVREGQRIHIKHGHYRFKDEKMSTRKGNTIWLKDVLEEAQKRAVGLAKDKDSSVAKEVGIGALKWNDLKRGSSLDIVFDWEDFLSMEGNSGPYLQYTFARTQSVLAKIKNQKSKIKITDQNLKFLEHLEPEELSLLRAIYRFPEVVGEAGENFSPNMLCNYLFDLSQKFNLFYQKHQIINPVILSEAKPGTRRYLAKHLYSSSDIHRDQNDKWEFRSALTKAVGQILKNGLNLLGIQAPEKM